MDLENLMLEQTRTAIQEEWHCKLGDNMKVMLLGLVKRIELAELHLDCYRKTYGGVPVSDLEIVQKALKTVGKYGGTLVFQDDGSCLIYEYPKMTDPHVIGFAECSNLLTWAKQRIGVA